MKRLLLLVAVLVTLAACGGASVGADPAENAPAPSGNDPADATTAPSTTPLPAAAGGSLPDGPSALRDPNADEFPDPLVEVSQIISGGPPPDGIPPIDDPVFQDIDTAEVSLDDNEAVVVLEIDGDVRAYPVEILIWHEIVNDTVGGVPVAITYCPLCNSAVTYERTVRGVETTFGTSGRLFASALVMYDRATESLWTHFDGRAVVGLLAGEQLEPVSSPLLSWADFKSAYPSGQVLSRDTGFNREYGRNPYFGYDNPETDPFLFRGGVDERAVAKQRVAGVTIGEASTAFTLEAISGGAARATHADVGDSGVVVFWKAGQNSALEDADTAGGRDVGSVRVFEPTVGGRALTFTAAGGTFVDDETGSTWDITGQAIAGELAGSRLEAIPHLDTFWFAWSTYRPGTTLFEG